MDRALALGSVAIVAATLGCSGDGAGTATGFKQNTGGGGGGSISSGSHHHAGAGGTGGGGAGGPSGPGAGAGGSGAGPGSGGSGTSTSSSSGGSGCGVFPQDNWWNANISNADVDPNSDNYVAFINANGGPGSQGNQDPLHADFDSVGDGIPFNVVDGSVMKVAVAFTYADESDPGPYPIPPNPLVESGGDRHILMVDTSECKLYELWSSSHSGGGWHAGSGAIFDLTSDTLRPDCWTSADAAGLPVYPGLARYSEVAAGEIKHALRFTVHTSRAAWIKPARHWASSTTNGNAPPMGLRFRLKSNGHVNSILSGATAQSRVVLTALQQYGMFLADNGTNWYVSGEPNSGWEDFHPAFDQLHGTDFEVVKASDPIELPASCP